MSARSESTRSYDADSIFTHDTINTTTDTINTVPSAHPDNLDKHVPAWNHSHMSYHLPAHMQSRAVPRGAAGIERRPLSRFFGSRDIRLGPRPASRPSMGFTWQMDWARPTRLRRHGKMPAVSMAPRGWRHASACRNHRAPPRTALRSRLCAGRWSSSPWLCNFKVDSAISSVEPHHPRGRFHHGPNTTVVQHPRSSPAPPAAARLDTTGRLPIQLDTTIRAMQWRQGWIIHTAFLLPSLLRAVRSRSRLMKPTSPIWRARWMHSITSSLPSPWLLSPRRTRRFGTI